MHTRKRKSLEKSGFIEDVRERETQSQQRRPKRKPNKRERKANERNQRREGQKTVAKATHNFRQQPRKGS